MNKAFFKNKIYIKFQEKPFQVQPPLNTCVINEMLEQYNVVV